jgi:hypothetical protein
MHPSHILLVIPDARIGCPDSLFPNPHRIPILGRAYGGCASRCSQMPIMVSGPEVISATLTPLPGPACFVRSPSRSHQVVTLRSRVLVIPSIKMGILSVETAITAYCYGRITDRRCYCRNLDSIIPNSEFAKPINLAVDVCAYDDLSKGVLFQPGLPGSVFLSLLFGPLHSLTWGLILAPITGRVADTISRLGKIKEKEDTNSYLYVT